MKQTKISAQSRLFCQRERGRERGEKEVAEGGIYKIGRRVIKRASGERWRDGKRETDQIEWRTVL